MMNGKEVVIADWHRLDIVAALHKRHFTLRGLSVDAGLKPDTLKNALNRPYPKGERIIAAALNMDPANIWPSRYLPYSRKAS